MCRQKRIFKMLQLVEGVGCITENATLSGSGFIREQNQCGPGTPIELTAISLQQLIDHFIEVLSVRLLHKHGLNMELDLQSLFGPHVP